MTVELVLSDMSQGTVNGSDRTAVDYAQTLLAYLDGSNGDVQPLFAAVDGVRTVGYAPFDVDAFEQRVRSMDAALDEAWDILEEGRDGPPLLSSTYIEYNRLSDDEAYFFAESGAAALTADIVAAVTVAREELDAAQDIVAEGEDVPTETLPGDFGVYESLGAYLDYVYSQVEGMVDFARQLDATL
jgi:hypothetical protein